MSAFAKTDYVLARYMPQLQHNMAVAGWEQALLSVIFGNGNWQVFEVASDWLHQQDLLTAEERFRTCSTRASFPLPSPAAVPAPLPSEPAGVKEVCLQGSSAYAASAADWLIHREAARKHQAATASLRELVEPDVARAFGYRMEPRRSKAGAVTIQELQT